MNKKTKTTFTSPSFEYFEKKPIWFVAITFFGGVVLVLSIMYQAYFLALIILLLFSTIFRISNIRPQKIVYEVADNGLKAGEKIYGWSNFRSFWVVENEKIKRNYLYLQPLNRFSQPISVIIPKNANVLDLQFQLRALIPESFKNGLHFTDRLNQIFRI